ncbi:MAG: hypothetical protein M3R48_08820, partial [Candidatus Dormibacteraeota bacterium]|nr:hypothetical protein [Candidatus Dormibacteraeota bacterium]
MSLLDRVQRKAEQSQATEPPRPVHAPAPAPDNDGPAVFETPNLPQLEAPVRSAGSEDPASWSAPEPNGWQVRHAPRVFSTAPASDRDTPGPPPPRPTPGQAGG